jgi:hypothetical protein
MVLPQAEAECNEENGRLSKFRYGGPGQKYGDYRP